MSITPDNFQTIIDYTLIPDLKKGTSVAKLITLFEAVKSIVAAPFRYIGPIEAVDSPPTVVANGYFFLATDDATYPNFDNVTAKIGQAIIKTDSGYQVSSIFPDLSMDLLNKLDTVYQDLNRVLPFARGEAVADYPGIDKWCVYLEVTFPTLADRTDLIIERIWNGGGGNYGFRIYRVDTDTEVCTFYANPFTPNASGFDTLILEEEGDSGITGKAIVHWSSMPVSNYNGVDLKIDYSAYRYQELIDETIKVHPFSNDDPYGKISNTFRAIKDIDIEFDKESEFYNNTGLREFEVTRIKRNNEGYCQIYISENDSDVLVFSIQEDSSGFQSVNLKEQNNSKLTAKAWINWSEIPEGTDTTNNEKHLLKPNYVVRDLPHRHLSKFFSPNIEEYLQFKGYARMPTDFVPYSLRNTVHKELTLETIYSGFLHLRIKNAPDNMLLALNTISRNSTTDGKGYQFSFIGLKSKNPSNIWSEVIKIYDISITEVVNANETERVIRRTIRQQDQETPTLAPGIIIEYAYDYTVLPDDFYCELNQKPDGSDYYVPHVIDPSIVEQKNFKEPFDSGSFDFETPN